jgi:hypothetical protein
VASPSLSNWNAALRARRSVVVVRVLEGRREARRAAAAVSGANKRPP